LDEQNLSSFAFRGILFVGIRRGFCQNVLECIEEKNGERNYPARRSRKIKDSGDFKKKMDPL
jgi:hypothetical protein